MISFVCGVERSWIHRKRVNWELLEP
jgi:hypothetical protein